MGTYGLVRQFGSASLNVGRQIIDPQVGAGEDPSCPESASYRSHVGSLKAGGSSPLGHPRSERPGGVGEAPKASPAHLPPTYRSVDAVAAARLGRRHRSGTRSPGLLYPSCTHHGGRDRITAG